MYDKYQCLMSSSWLQTLSHTHTYVTNSRVEEAGRQLARLKIQRVKPSVLEPEKQNVQVICFANYIVEIHLKHSYST